MRSTYIFLISYMPVLNQVDTAKGLAKSDLEFY